MTNRRELLDSALLRPGRLEVQIEIPLPDRLGRREILKIHFDALRKNGRLSKPLCCAIDGVKCDSEEDVYEEPAQKSKRVRLKQLVNKSLTFSAFDLAADSVTGGFSGADLQGLVRCAGSLALSRARQNNYGVEDLQVTLEDVKMALLEIKQ
jgi:vesicle-fusing ATPase